MNVLLAGVARLSWLGLIVWFVVMHDKKRKMRKVNTSLHKEQTKLIKPTMCYGLEEANFVERQLPAFLKHVYPDMVAWKFKKYAPSHHAVKGGQQIIITHNDGRVTTEIIIADTVKAVVSLDKENKPVVDKAKYWMIKKNPNGLFGYYLQDCRADGYDEITIKLPKDFSNADVSELASLFEKNFNGVKATLGEDEGDLSYRRMVVNILDEPVY